MFEIYNKNVPDAISYTVCTRTGDVKFGPKVFLWTSLWQVILLIFIWVQGFLCASCVLFTHTEQLAEPTAVFIPKSPSSLYKPSLAPSFQLLLELLHLAPITSDRPWLMGVMDPRLGIPAAALLCLCSVPARPTGHWWIPESFKALHKRIPWKLRFAARRILC